MQEINTEALKNGFDTETYITFRMTITGKGTNRIDGVCPLHSGKGKTNNFSYYTNTKTWHCFGSCGGGDIITFVQKELNKDFRGACEYLGFDSTSHTSETTKPKASTRPLLEREQGQTQEWKETAGKMVKWCEGKLWGEHSDKLLYLNERGLSDEIIREYRIGYNPKMLSRPLDKWGFNPLDYDKDKQITILQGYTIPWIYNGHVNAIAIRLDRGGYGSVMGGVKQTMFALDKVQNKPVLVVETELDAMLVNAHLGELVTGVASGAVTCGRGFWSISTLLMASKVLLAFDNDAPRDDNKPNAGDTATLWWLDTLASNAKEHRTPSQYKDIGEMFSKGGNIVRWCKEGLGLQSSPFVSIDIKEIRAGLPFVNSYTQSAIGGLPLPPSSPQNAYTG